MLRTNARSTEFLKRSHDRFIAPLDKLFKSWFYRCVSRGKNLYGNRLSVPDLRLGCRPLARRSRLAGHGSPIFFTTTDADAGFSKFSSPFKVAAFVPHRAGPAFAESASPSNHAGGSFAEAGMDLPKSASRLPKSALGFAVAGWLLRSPPRLLQNPLAPCPSQKLLFHNVLHTKRRFFANARPISSSNHQPSTND